MLTGIDWRENQKSLPCPQCKGETVSLCFCGPDKARFECSGCGWRIPPKGCDADKRGLIGAYIGTVNNKEGENE